MPDGFFNLSTLPDTKAIIPLLPRCGACGLFRGCRSPKMPWSGEGRRKVLLIGEAPGRNEDEQGTQFIGESGQLLERSLKKFGVPQNWLAKEALFI